MKLETCKAVRRHLAACHDDELPVAAVRQVRAHLDWCPRCADEARWLVAFREAVRAMAARRSVSSGDPTTGLPASVVAQAQAEEAVSLPVRIRALKEQRHLLWGGAGAAFASVVWAAIAAGLLYFVTPVRTDSLAGILSALGSPGSNENPYRPDARIRLPRVAGDGWLRTIALPELPDEEFAYALAAVITREGQVADLALLLSNNARDEAVANILSAASATRFEPARFGTTPVAVSLVWVVTRTTVRGSLNG